MTDLRKAAEMALEALSKVMLTSDKGVACENAKKALRQALAEPEQEPVAWLIQYKTRHDIVWGSAPGLRNNDQILGMEPLYTAPVDAVNMSQERVDETAKREHEPMAWFVQYEDSHEFVWSRPDGWRVKQALEIQPLYTAPPKREWVGLTEYQRLKFADRFHISEVAIEAIASKLKEKNG